MSNKNSRSTEEIIAIVVIVLPVAIGISALWAYLFMLLWNYALVKLGV